MTLEGLVELKRQATSEKEARRAEGRVGVDIGVRKRDRGTPLDTMDGRSPQP